MTLDTQKRRATVVFLGSMLLYVASVLLAAWLQQAVFTDGLAHGLVAVLPVCGVLVLVWATLRLFLAGDELERQAAGIAAVATLALFSTITLCWGILESMAGVPAVNPLWWGVTAMGSWSLIFSLVLRWRYQ